MSAAWGDDSKRSIGRDFAELVGWYVSEGEKPRNGSVRINQSDSANPAKVIRIRGLLTSLGATFSERVRTRPYRDRQSREVVFTVRGEIADRLIGACKNKQLPEWCHELPEDESQSMLAGLVDGDGHRRADGRSCIIQKDRDSIGRMQVLAIRCGYRTLLKARAKGDFALYLTRGRWLTLRGTNGKWECVSRTKYDGTVWCPSVRSGFWLARRGGMPFITGNTFPPDLVRPCIRAGSSERGCCPSCLAPWERITERRRRATRPGTASKVTGDSLTDGNRDPQRHVTTTTTIGWRPTCCCETGEPIPCLILDPFGGSGTTVAVANEEGRRGIACDLNLDYVALAHERMSSVVFGSGPLPKKIKRPRRPKEEPNLFTGVC